MSDLTDTEFYPSAAWTTLRNIATSPFENHGNVAEGVWKLRLDFGRREAPSASYARYLLKKVKETGILIDKPPISVKSQKQCIHPRILLLWQKVCGKLHQHQFNVVLSNWTFRRHHWNEFYIKTLVGMTPYKVQLVQELKPIDHPMRFRFANWVCDRLTEYNDFGKKKNSFSNEAHFDLDGYVNKQNCRIWSIENPHAYIEKPMHPKRCTVWTDFGPEA